MNKIKSTATLLLLLFAFGTGLQAQSANHPAMKCSNCSLLSPKFIDGVGSTLRIQNSFRLFDGVGAAVVVSPNQQYVLFETSTGYALKGMNQEVIWSVVINGNLQGGRLKMQNDGNLVFYSASGSALWATDSSSHPESSDGEEKYLMLQDDGNLVIYDWDSMSADDPMWATGTCGGVVNGCGTPGAR